MGRSRVLVLVLASAMPVLLATPSTAEASPAAAPGRRVMAQVDLGAHVPPVERPVIDPFRDPGSPWLSGNRGLEFDTVPGDLIRASADGVVTFAGQVAGQLHVTVRHSSELRTTMAFVVEVRVAVGDAVRRGDVLAVAGETFHFTARRGDRYIDPTTLFDDVSYSVRLIASR